MVSLQSVHLHRLLARTWLSKKLVTVIVALVISMNSVFYVGTLITLSGTENMLRETTHHVRPHSVFRLVSEDLWNRSEVNRVIEGLNPRHTATAESVLVLGAVAWVDGTPLQCTLIGVVDIVDSSLFNTSSSTATRSLAVNETLVNHLHQEYVNINDSITVSLPASSHPSQSVDVNLTVAGYVQPQLFSSMNDYSPNPVSQTHPEDSLFFCVNWTTLSIILDNERVPFDVFLFLDYEPASFSYSTLDLFRQSIENLQSETLEELGTLQATTFNRRLFDYVQAAQAEFTSIYYKSLSSWITLLISSWIVFSMMIELVIPDIMQSLVLLKKHGIRTETVVWNTQFACFSLSYGLSTLFLLLLSSTSQTLFPLLGISSDSTYDLIPLLFLPVAVSLVVLHSLGQNLKQVGAIYQREIHQARSATQLTESTWSRGVIVAFAAGCYYLLSGLLGFSATEAVSRLLPVSLFTFIFLFVAGLFEMFLSQFGSILFAFGFVMLLSSRRDTISNWLQTLTETKASPLVSLGVNGALSSKKQLATLSLFMILLASMSVMSEGTINTISHHRIQTSRSFVGSDFSLQLSRGANITSIMEALQMNEKVTAVSTEFWLYASVTSERSTSPTELLVRAIDTTTWSSVAFLKGLGLGTDPLSLLDKLDESSILLTKQHQDSLRVKTDETVNISFSDSQDTQEAKVIGILDSSANMLLATRTESAIMSMEFLNHLTCDNIFVRVLGVIRPHANMTQLHSEIDCLDGVDEVSFAGDSTLPMIDILYFDMLERLSQTVAYYLFSLTALLILVLTYYSLRRRDNETSNLSSRGVSVRKTAAFLSGGITLWLLILVLLGWIIGIASYAAGVSVTSHILDEVPSQRFVFAVSLLYPVLFYLLMSILSSYVISHYLSKKNRKWR